MVSSVPVGDEIGVVYADAGQTWLATHARAPGAPNGTGDLLTALFTAGLIGDLDVGEALARAVGGLVEAVFAAEAAGARDLPITTMGRRLGQVSARVRMEQLA